MATASAYMPQVPVDGDLERLRRGILAIATRNGHQVEALELICRRDLENDAVRFDLRWLADGDQRKCVVLVSSRAVAGRYAREEFDERIVKHFPPAPPLPPVFLDAGAGI